MQPWSHTRRSQGADANQPHSDIGTKPQAEFKFFSKLPAELRLTIWELALEQPRAIFITHEHIRNRQKLELPAYPGWRCPVTGRRYEQASVLLFVSHEARAAALNYNHYSFFSVVSENHGVPDLHFAITPNDFVVVDAEEMLRTVPDCTINITPSRGFARYDGGRHGYRAPAIRRFLVLQNKDELKSNKDLITCLSTDNKRGVLVYHLIAEWTLENAEELIVSPTAVEDLESIHCLAEDWTAREPHGLRSLNSLPNADISIWDSCPLLNHVTTLYDREIAEAPRTSDAEKSAAQSEDTRLDVFTRDLFTVTHFDFRFMALLFNIACAQANRSRLP